MEGRWLCSSEFRWNHNGTSINGVDEDQHANLSLQPDVSSKPCDSNVPGAYLLYNEFIAYNVDQIRLRYLFRIRMK